MDETSGASSRRSGRRRILLLLAVGACGVAVAWRLRPPAPSVSFDAPVSANRLALGEEAASEEPLTIPVAPPMEFDGLTRAEVLALRERAVAKEPALLLGGYRPFDAVFAKIRDGRPWWGLAGRFYFGPGERSMAGPSLHAHYILNPFLLVGADFWHDCELRWDLAKVTPEKALAPDFPYLPRIVSLRWWPAARRAEAVYDLGEHLDRQTPLLDPETPFRNTRVDLIAYNARDLGLGWIYVDLDRSERIGKAGHEARAFRIPHYIHRGGSCDAPGGCNNMSPRFPAVEELVLEARPARIVVRLWRGPPPSPDAPPDLLWTLVIR